MWRWVIRDYFVAFGWDRLKVWLKADKVFWIFYFCVLFPLITGFFEKLEYSLIYAIVMVPVAFCLTSNSLHQNSLPKIFYLTPMEQEVRKRYMERTYMFRILVAGVVGAVFSLLLWMGSFCEPLTAVLFFINAFILGILVCGFGVRKVKVPENSNIQRDDLYTGGVAHTCNLLITMLATFGICAMLCFDIPVESWCKWIFAGVVLLLQLPLTIKFLSGWSEAVENAVNYEKSSL